MKKMVFALCGLLILLSSCVLGKEQSQGKRYVKVVREYADKVLEYGKDNYGSKRTPLLADGINVGTKAPVCWERNGEKWILSNLASQQSLLRTLVGLTNLTGDGTYRSAAEEAVKYSFGMLGYDEEEGLKFETDTDKIANLVSWVRDFHNK